jgi:uncharacterized protein DUF3108
MIVTLVRSAASVLALAASPIVLGSQSAAPRPSDRPVPFHVGETLTYDISWTTFLTAGTATLTVKERRAVSATAAVYDLVAEGRPVPWLDRLYHLYYKAESLVNTSTLHPSLATVYSDEHGHKTLKSSRFPAPTRLEFQETESSPVERKTVPAGTLDTLSAIYAIRAATLKAGQVVTMSVVEDATVYAVRWQIGAPEPIKTPLGTISAWRVTPALFDTKGQPVTDRKIVIWLSDDARRLPLKFETDLPVGTFTFTLTNASK